MLNRLLKSNRNQCKRYEKKSAHHAQVDVKLLFFNNENGKKIKHYQYTAIGDAIRIYALKIYSKHTQANAIDFINHLIDKLPF
ncbi:hypothetical protein Psal006b_01406 [Piscirickettsia salmonis]|uniref:Integrase n=1 Tax=Piscirickettsia salmonis TaxID=1238 RepID=A0AAC9EV11_PISSA|nr:hypothetical protein [Piscirickettsia salmonis]ALB22983.1 integrase [Piscirickettsia salmonis]ALT18457.1 hypothetical protein PSLF89_06195 [Piscirickettsia salmonis LF-89 = ATCC VR-1361]ALY02930.1 hypothetical protein AWE47_08810 [Piscirickettsia salmonis]AMA42486.1 hypothetical protein AWJ11_09020 [Piscirickettsia salmonis]AOS34956.1 hypothetical protein AVM72_06160 [Piscirickettsia salmonis]